MNLKKLKVQQKKLSKKLNNVIQEIQKRELIGYRAFKYGDEYNYGGYSDFLFKNSKYIKKGLKYTRKEALKRAQDFDSYEPIYTNSRPYEGKVH